jgi:hypothetical protein
MSMLSSIMEFIRGKEEAPAASAPSPELLTLIESQQPPQPPMYEGYMPDDSNTASAKKAWRDNIRNRAIKGLLKKAEENEDERNARLLRTAKEPDSRYDAVNYKEVKWEDNEEYHKMDAKRRLEAGEKKRQEAAWKKKQMRKP